MPFLLDSPEAVAAARLSASQNAEVFWADIARHYDWMKPWNNVCSAEFETPSVRWFEGAELNITANCLDRHLAEHGDRKAILWEPNDPAEDPASITYSELHGRVCRFANVLKLRGVKKGDRVALYLPMVPELAVAVLACARIGAVHSVVFAGFSARSLADRIQDAGAVCVITSDGMKRGAKGLALKAVVDEALAECPTVTTNLVVRHTGEDVQWNAGRDVWLHEALTAVSGDCPPEPMDSEDLLFILYTSGSTGKPKGVVHTCGGYMVYAGYSFANVFQYQPGDVYWCTADIGWITGHSYIVYGPLLNGATTVMFEGVPTYPSPARFWEVCEKLKVNQFYTAPTAIRALMACEPRFAEGHDLSALKVIGSVGSPSTRRPGSGTTTSWSADACASSIPGGRPRPAASSSAGSAPQPHEARPRRISVARHIGRPRGRRRQHLGRGGRRLPLHRPPLAVHDPHHLRRPRAVPQRLLQRLQGQVLHR